MKTSASEAKSTTVYVVLPIQGKSVKKTDGILFKTTETTGYQIEKRSLYDHIMESAERTKNPNGFTPRLHVVPTSNFELRSWLRDNGRYIVIKSYKTQSEADDALFSLVYSGNFLLDETRDCSWFETEGEAVFYRNERYAELHGIDILVAASILRKKDMVEKYRNEIAIKPYEKIKSDEANLAAGYENIIEFIPGERYDDTCARLIKVLPERVDAPKFHAIVRTLRREWLKKLPPKVAI